MFTAASSDIFREVPDRVQIDTTQKRQKTTENQNAMGRQPSLSRTDVILPYCFYTDEDAANWLASRKGREKIQQIHAKYEKAGARQQPLCASNAAGQHPQELAFGHAALEHQSL